MFNALSQPKILVVDDEPDNFDVIEGLLENENYELSYASNGQKALSLFKTFQPDLILLDVMMPEMNGLELCQQLKSNQQCSHIPVIIVTALTTKQDLSQCLEAGADDFISKPVNGVELRARIRSMLRIKQQYDNVQSLLQVREDMVYMIVHDLKNPLTDMILSTNLLKRYEYPREQQQQKLDKVEASIHKLESMIDSLLLMAKLEAGKLHLNCVKTDLAWLCQSAVADFETISAQKKLKLFIQFPETSRFLWIDPTISRRIVDNLISNAIKFSASNKEISLRVSYPETGGAIVQVIDSGPGVSEALQKVIFEKYEIGTFIEGVNQTGLGLAFCKIAIEAHKGWITVENNQYQGATFTIFFPGVPPEGSSYLDD